LQINTVNDPATATGVQLAELEILGTPVVNSVTVSPTILYLEKNDVKQLYATVAPSNSINTLIWSSSNDAVATVSSTGLVRAKAAGTATITATAANNNKTATCDLTVGSGITKYEAENAVYGGGPWVGNSDAGYSGTGYLRNFGEVDSYVEFSITRATTGALDVTMHYTSGVASSCHLYVNGVMIRQVTIPTTNGWNNWSDYAVNVTLNAGSNTIKFQHDADDTGYYYFDYLSLRNIENSTGIFEISNSEKESDILLSPNPLSTGSLLIKLPEDATRLSIFDVTGKIVYHEKVTRNEYFIDQSVFKSKGVYIVNVMTKKNIMNKKIIVLK